MEKKNYEGKLAMSVIKTYFRTSIIKTLAHEQKKWTSEIEFNF